jgi:hypothetical protein
MLIPSFDVRPVAFSRTVEIWARDVRVGTVTFTTRREWLAETGGGESRHCASFGMALAYIEAVVQTGEWLDLRGPGPAVH